MQHNIEKVLMKVNAKYHKHDTSKVLSNINKFQSEFEERKDRWANESKGWPEQPNEADL